MRRTLDLRLYLVTDRPLCLGRDLLEVAAKAVRGGATIVQLREKHCETAEFVALARAMRAMLDGTGVPLIINDRVDVALAAGAAGVHLGQSDFPVAVAREMLGQEAIIGLSVETLDQALAAEDSSVDYLGVSPLFATPTKTDTGRPWGLDGLRGLREASRLPLVAIGGITPGNAAEAIVAGAHGVAVVSAICSADSPEESARRLIAEVDLGLMNSRFIRTCSEQPPI